MARKNWTVFPVLLTKQVVEKWEGVSKTDMLQCGDVLDFLTATDVALKGCQKLQTLL